MYMIYIRMQCMYCNVLPCHVMSCNAMPCLAIECNAVHYNACTYVRMYECMYVYNILYMQVYIPTKKKQTQEPSEESEEAPKAAHPMPSRVFLPQIQPGITGQHDLYIYIYLYIYTFIYNTYQSYQKKMSKL